MTAIEAHGDAFSSNAAHGRTESRGGLRFLARNGLKVALVLAGANTLFTGLNRAFGGIATLGWQGPADFLSVVSEHAYLIQDNHNRFLGGVWALIGLTLIVSPVDLKRFRPILNFIFALIFAGGLARFTALRWDVVLGPEVVVSVIAELVGMPLLFIWLSKVLGRETA